MQMCNIPATPLKVLHMKIKPLTISLIWYMPLFLNQPVRIVFAVGVYPKLTLHCHKWSILGHLKNANVQHSGNSPKYILYQKIALHHSFNLVYDTYI